MRNLPSWLLALTGVVLLMLFAAPAAKAGGYGNVGVQAVQQHSVVVQQVPVYSRAVVVQQVPQYKQQRVIVQQAPVVKQQRVVVQQVPQYKQQRVVVQNVPQYKQQQVVVQSAGGHHHGGGSNVVVQSAQSNDRIRVNVRPERRGFLGRVFGR